MLKRLICLFSFLFLHNIASANSAGVDYQFGVNGGTPTPVKNKHVRMAREFVRIEAEHYRHKVKAEALTLCR